MTADRSPMFTLVLTLAPRVTVTWSGLRGFSGETRLTDRPLVAALTEGASLERLLEIGTPRAGRDVRGVLDVLHERLLLAWQVRDAEGRAWATLTPQRPGIALPVPEDSGGSLALSRFALLRVDAGGWLLESGRSPWRASLSNDAAAAVAAGHGPAELSALLGMGGLRADSDDDAASRYWEFHDRYFASQSRPDAAAWGATFRFADRPEPALVRPPHVDLSVALPLPDATDPGPGIWEVAEQRRSHPALSDAPLPLAALGSLLWHTLRIIGSFEHDPSTPLSYEGLRRPVPSGGAMHSVGLWLICRNVEGLAAGVWWYDPAEHALLRVADAPPTREPDVHQAYGYLVSRHARVAWKYERIAHALALKDAGVILHALQAAATALDIAMCPVGSGPTSSVLSLLGLDDDEYVPVGEFWLATRL